MALDQAALDQFRQRKKEQGFSDMVIDRAISTVQAEQTKRQTGRQDLINAIQSGDIFFEDLSTDQQIQVSKSLRGNQGVSTGTGTFAPKPSKPFDPTTDPTTQRGIITQTRADREEAESIKSIVELYNLNPKVFDNERLKNLPVKAQLAISKQSGFKQPRSEEDKKVKIITMQLDSIEELLTSGTISTGRIGGRIEQVQSFLGLDPSLRQLRQKLKIAAPVIGKNILELGRLTDEDIQLALETLPDETGTPEEIADSILTLRNILRERYGADADLLSTDQSQQPKLSDQPPILQSTQPSLQQSLPAQPPILTQEEESNEGFLAKAGKIGDVASNFLIPRIKEFSKVPGKIFDPTQALTPVEPGVSPLSAVSQSTGQFARIIAAPAAEIATFIGAGPLARIGLIKGGALAGGLLSATDPERKTTGERITGTAFGTALGGAFGGIFKGAPGIVGKIIGKPEQIIRQLFKPVPGKVQQFRRNTGLNFENEIVKREGKAIRGLDYDGLINHFGERFKDSLSAVEKVVAKSNAVFNKKPLMNKIDETLAFLLDPKQGNIGQQETINKLQSIRNDVVQIPNEVNAVVYNRIKRRLQDLGEEAFSVSGKATATSKQFAKLSTFVKREIENKVPATKGLNQDIQLYRLARDSIDKRAEQVANQVTQDALGRILQAFPALATVIGFGAGGFQGAAIAGGITLGAPALRQKLQQPTTATARAALALELVKVGQNPIMQKAVDLFKKLGIITAAQAAKIISESATEGSELPEQPPQLPSGGGGFERIESPVVQNRLGDVPPKFLFT